MHFTCAVPSRRALAVLLCCCLPACCTTRETVYFSKAYRLPLDAPEDVACFRRCNASRIEGRERYAQCLEACPGTRVAPGGCKREDEPPVAECVRLEHTRERVVRRSPFAEGVGIGAFIGLGALFLAASRGKAGERAQTQ